MTPDHKSDNNTRALREAILVFSLAITAAVLVKIPVLFGIGMVGNDGFYIRNFSLFVLPLLVVYFSWKRSLKPYTLRWSALAFVAVALFANIYPFVSWGQTEGLAALHIPIVLWLIVGISYTGNRWSQMNERMNFIRFSGELFIYYVLIALGGFVTMAFMAMIFRTIEFDIEPIFESWILPCGIVGAVIVASWLVEIKQGLAENLAPILARLFSPVFAIVLITYLGTLLYTGRALEIEREILIGFDLLLVVVLGLLLYSISARNPEDSPGIFDIIQIVLLISALISDVVALWAIFGRIIEWGFTPNRIVGLGMNVILLINLAWSAVLYIRFLRGRVLFSALEKWQTDYIPVYAIWAAIVVVIFPPLFGYV